tara:strand:+ start:635 stop:1759 length:1125 start_codon:yes stop_codon:yes gene_type:complete
MSEKVSIITIFHGDEEFIPLIRDNYNRFLNKANHTNYLQELELVIVDDGKQNLIKEFCDLDNILYLHLNGKEVEKYNKEIIDNFKQPNKSLLYYEKKRNRLPDGFLRDYGCGMSSHDNIFHMNMDCIYNPKSIQRKLSFMKRVGAECVFCDTTLAYDMYGKELYKTESPFKIYESTLLHTREFWKRRGFQWSDTMNEGKAFHYDNGIDRKMDNYYDTIQLLGIHNINQYKPVKVSIDGLNIKIPDILSEINIITHPFKKYINELFGDEISILGLESEFLVNVENDDHWKTHNITEKWKQTKLSKMVKAVDDKFNVFLYSSKHPAWDLFKNVQFDIIILETYKNYEQMCGIILENKVYEYIHVKGLFIRKDFLEN